MTNKDGSISRSGIIQIEAVRINRGCFSHDRSRIGLVTLECVGYISEEISVTLNLSMTENEARRISRELIAGEYSLELKKTST